jgi:PAS domain S-box-containing protein
MRRRMVHRSPLPAIDVPSQPLPAFLQDGVRDLPEKAALVDGMTGRLLTYAALWTAARRTAAGLVRRGVRKGDVVAIWSPNALEYPIAVFGTMLAGGIVTTVNALYTAEELAHQLRDVGARVLVTSAVSADAAQSAARSVGVGQVFAFGRAASVPSFDELLDGAGDAPDVPVDPHDDVAAILYSSATTGLPKGVMLTHENLAANVRQVQAAERMDVSEIVLGVMPLYHIYGFNVVMNLTLSVGATLVLLERFEVQSFLETLETYGVTTAFLVPPLVRTLALHPLVDRYDVSRLRHVLSAAAPLPEYAAVRCAERIRCEVKQGYGLTETSPSTHYTPRGRVKLNAAGVALPNTEWKIADVAARRDLADGEIGEVWVRGPQVMKGYLNNPEATRRVIDDEGWLHTGDIGYADGDGYLYVLDRAKDQLKFRGLQYREDELLLTTVEESARRREAERRLRFQGLLLNSVRESIVGIDTARVVTFWNKGAEALFGYTAEEALGVPVDRLIVADPDTARGEYADLAAHGQWQGQVQRRRKDGSLLWTDVVASVVSTPEGQASGWIAIHRDVTELRRNQEMVQESHEQLRNLAARLMDIREQERTAFARELHDELGQTLTRLTIDLCWLLERLPKRLRSRRTDAIVPIVRRMVTTVQHLSWRQRPAVLDDLGLDAAIEWQVQEFEEWSGCRCVADLRIESLPADRDRDTAVFRILQEALVNVARHAKATCAAVRGHVAAGRLVLEVIDDGIGIAPHELTSPASLGLLGMRERARSMGATLHIGRAGDRGTSVRLDVPVAMPLVRGADA